MRHDGGARPHIDATELARLIRSKELSPAEIMQALRERTDALGPKLNAIVTPIGGAEECAHEAEAPGIRGHGPGQLHGVPFTTK